MIYITPTSVFDKPARSKATNMLNPFGPLRNELSYEHDLFSAKNKGLAVNGFKKVSSLSDLKYYNPILSVNVDRMHNIGLRSHQNYQVKLIGK
ncbi:hypothetical protein BpHYR1_038256 [Brachionus plicatilis]|uniref:Uncharacterized protein n=1 Tax=Brachionus plicatilis TaxID=10195 RepID=A0A3M7P4I5_BRAPC|nr:hypothetical protein BpHYR1_038256 [Brachionus plicatilis]